MSTPKKASVKAQSFCSKLQGKELPKSTTWAQCTDIIYEHYKYAYDMRTQCKVNMDNTIIKLYKEDPEVLLETFSLPNSEVFIEKEGDWDWPTVHKLLVEYFIKNWKKLSTGKKTRTKKVKADTNELMKRVPELKDLIKTAKGTEKKKLLKEYNEKSALLSDLLEQQAEEAKRTQEARKASVDELNRLKRRKQALMQRIKEWEKKGKDTTELKAELSEVVKQLAKAKTGRA